METNLIKYFENGISIDRLPNGKFTVFTRQTQRFTIDSLEELTPQAFENAIEYQKDLEYLHKQMKESLKIPMEQQKIEGVPVNKLTFEYFKSITELPKINNIVVKNGDKVSVGNKYQLILNDGTTYNVYVHSVYFNSKKLPDKNEIGFIIADTGRLETISIGQIKKTVKEFSLIS